MSDQVIWCGSAVENGQQVVRQTYGDRTQSMSVTEARIRAAGLYHAAAVAEQEAIAYNTFRIKSSGFTPANDDPGLKLIRLLRSQRQPLTPGLRCMIDRGQGEPLVVVEFMGLEFSLRPPDARELGRNLLQAAEASEQEAFLRKFMTTEIDCSPDELGPFMQRFLMARQQFKLEDILKFKEDS